MDRAGAWATATIGGLIVGGLAVAAVLFGLRGVEVASWLAGVAGLLVAVITLFLARSSGAGRRERASQDFDANARGHSRVYQAGRDIRISDTERPSGS